MKKPVIAEEGPAEGMFDTWNEETGKGEVPMSPKKGKKMKKGKC